MTKVNQIKKTIIAEPKSGCNANRINNIAAYVPDTNKCHILEISTCLLKKYFARTNTKISFDKSVG